MTLIVPVYNGAHVLPLTTPAVLAQPVDAIVYVDDGSTDGTAGLLRPLAEADGRVTVLTLDPNRGRAAARNAGVAHAGGDVLLFLDADVAPAEGFAEAMREAVTASGAVAAVGQLDYAALDPADPYHRYLGSTRRGHRAEQSGSVPWRFFLSGIAAVRAEALAQVGGFPESVRYGEDLALACLLASQAPEGLLAAPEARALLLDAGDLDTALEKLKLFAADLPIVRSVCPDALEVAGLGRLVSPRPQDRLGLGLGRWRLPAESVRASSLLPEWIQPLAVRYLLGHTLAAHVPTDAVARAA